MKIRELRYRRGLTQAQLAGRAGVGEKTLKRLEAGKTDTPHPETLAAVAGALGLRPEELFDALPAIDLPEVSARPALHQLPRAPHSFTGREAQIAELLEAVVDRGDAVVLIHGMGGIGKTALGLVLAERLSDRFPDAQFYLDLCGASEPLTPVEGMLHVIRSIEPERALPNTDAAVAAAYRSVLRGRKSLLFMDNAVGREQVEPLIPPAGSLLLLTSRQRFALQGLHALSLSPLPLEEARALLSSLTPRTSAVGAELAGLCGGLPLALSLAGRALAERPDLDPGEYVARLADDRGRLQQLDAAESAGGVEASFALSYEMLDADQQAGLCALSVFPHSFDRAAAAAVWDVAADAADARIGLLLRFNLLESSGAGSAARYRLHDLVRLFAAARLPPEARELAARRHARHYLELLQRAQCEAVAPRSQGRLLRALSMVDDEWVHIHSAYAFCRSRLPDDVEAAALCRDAPFAANVLRLRQHPAQRVDWCSTAIELMQREGKTAAEGRMRCHAARAYQELGDPRSAIEHCTRAVELAVQGSDRQAEVNALVAKADAYHALGEPAKTIELSERALSLARELGARADEAAALNVLAWGYRVMGDLSRAIESCEQALPIARELRDRALEGAVLIALGFAHQANGEGERGRECARHSMRIARELGDRRMEGYSLIVLAEREQAEASYQESQRIAREVGDRRMEGNALLAMGLTATAQGRLQEAIGRLEQSLSIAEQTGDRSMEGIALTALGVAYTSDGRVDSAIEALARDERLSADMGNRGQEALAAWLLGCALELRGELDAALAAMERSEAYQREISHPGLMHTRQRISALRVQLRRQEDKGS